MSNWTNFTQTQQDSRNSANNDQRHSMDMSNSSGDHKQENSSNSFNNQQEQPFQKVFGNSSNIHEQSYLGNPSDKHQQNTLRNSSIEDQQQTSPNPFNSYQQNLQSHFNSCKQHLERFHNDNQQILQSFFTRYSQQNLKDSPNSCQQQNLDYFLHHHQQDLMCFLNHHQQALECFLNSCQLYLEQLLDDHQQNLKSSFSTYQQQTSGNSSSSYQHQYLRNSFSEHQRQSLEYLYTGYPQQTSSNSSNSHQQLVQTSPQTLVISDISNKFFELGLFLNRCYSYHIQGLEDNQTPSTSFSRYAASITSPLPCDEISNNAFVCGFTQESKSPFFSAKPCYSVMFLKNYNNFPYSLISFIEKIYPCSFKNLQRLLSSSEFTNDSTVDSLDTLNLDFLHVNSISNPYDSLYTGRRVVCPYGIAQNACIKNNTHHEHWIEPNIRLDLFNVNVKVLLVSSDSSMAIRLPEKPKRLKVYISPCHLRYFANDNLPKSRANPQSVLSFQVTGTSQNIEIITYFEVYIPIVIGFLEHSCPKTLKITIPSTIGTIHVKGNGEEFLGSCEELHLNQDVIKICYGESSFPTIRQLDLSKIPQSCKVFLAGKRIQ